MPELRKDPIVGRWVIISTKRGQKPTDWSAEPRNKVTAACPFCPGNESETPPEIMAVRADGLEANSPGWEVRVVPNKYPALQIEGDLDARGNGIYDMMNGIGAHEVILETPRHAADFADLSEEQVLKVLQVYRDRTLDLRNDRRFKYILIFKNHGQDAGASLQHSHSQLIATPIIPKRVAEELAGSRRFYESRERCIFCDIVRQELKSDKRLVMQTEHFVAIEPFAPRFPYETWILPKGHFSHYETMTAESYREVAAVLCETMGYIDRALGAPPFNFILHSAPVQEGNLDDYHWHFEIIPKLTKVAGFEWGSGFYINPVPPEVAAEELRQCRELPV